MKFDLSTQLKLSQLQTLAPQLQQSMKLLQLPSLDLYELIEEQLVTNPVLEQFDPDQGSESNYDMSDFNPDAQDIKGSYEENQKSVGKDFEEYEALDPYSSERGEKALDKMVSESENWSDFYNEDNISYKVQNEAISYNEFRPTLGDEHDFQINSITKKSTLYDELSEQYREVVVGAAQEKIFEYILGSLDNSGFLTETAEEIAADLGQPLDLVQELITQFKGFYPPGIGAANLQECLLIQLEKLDKKKSMAYTIVKDFYTDILKNRLNKIEKRLGLSHEHFLEAIHEIGELDPRPGRNLNLGYSQVIRPDIIVKQREDGSFEVETNDNFLPYVRITPKIKDWIKSKSLDKNSINALKEQVREGEVLINNVQFRKRTILAVAEAIVKHQEQFFVEGASGLKPLSMKVIAKEVGVHEATVSRTVNGKYMDTPQGMIEMRYFFNVSVIDSMGNEVSTNAAKSKLKEIIDGEDKTKPFSDEKLAEKLTQEGFPISRRTVVKYRQAKAIPNARQRKNHL